MPLFPDKNARLTHSCLGGWHHRSDLHLSGVDRVGNAIQVTGQIQIEFGNFADIAG